MKNAATSRILFLILFVFFAVVLFTALAVNCGAYDLLADEYDETNECRYTNGVIVNSIRSADSCAAIKEGEGPQGKSIVMMEKTDAGLFEKRIYLWQGGILLEFAQSGEPYTPSNGTKLAESETFDFSLEPNLLRVTTDEGSADIAIRSYGSEVG